jgi:hypothetical protein
MMISSFLALRHTRPICDLLPVACALMLAGCQFAANSQDELRANAARRYEFDAPGNYQASYKRIADMARQCYAGAAINSAIQVEADLLPDLRRGTVAISANQFGTQYWATSEITPGAQDTTHVVVWNYRHGWDEIGPKFEAWSEGKTSCN